MRGYVNRHELKMIVVFGIMLLPIAVLCYENKLSIGNITSIQLFIILMLMLLTYNIEIPIATIRTKKNDYVIQYVYILEKLFSIPLYEDINTSKERIFNTKITVNMAGAIIPLLATLYILYAGNIVMSIQIALIITVITFLVSEMIDGVGMKIPIVTGLCSVPFAILLDPNNAASVVFTSSILGIIMGSIASLLTLNKEKNGSAYLSIGGVGSFPAIYVTIIVASLISYYIR